MRYRELTDRQFQIDALDGLRGLAALIVVFSHTSYLKFFFLPFLDLRGTGKSGVFLFFLLSAFLLTTPLLNKGDKLFSFEVMARYWQRRFFRIFPLYTLYLLVALLTTWLLSTRWGEGLKALPFKLTGEQFISHLFLQEGQGVTWSIAVEFKFYFILPFLVFLINPILAKGKLYVLLFFCILIFGSQVISPQSASLTNDPSLLPYLPIFFMGVGLSVIQKIIYEEYSGSKICARVITFLGYVGVLGIIAMVPAVYSLLGKDVPNDYFHRQFILYAIFWSFILLAVVNVKGLLHKAFNWSLLRYCGALSFGIYLFHPVVLELVKDLCLNDFLSAWIILLISVVAAYCSYRALEEPISRVNFKLRR